MSAIQSATRAYAMPSLGADMDEGTVIEWLVGVGDSFERGQVVARIETEKSDIDIEIWHDGTVVELVVGPNGTVPVGATLMRFHPAAGDQLGVDATEASSADQVMAAVTEVFDPPREERSVEKPTFDRPAGDVWATPLARRLAGQRGIALVDVVGSGPEGAVRASDLSKSTTPGPTTPDGGHPAAQARPSGRSDRMRAMIAARMDRSNREIPHYRLERDIDLGCLLDRLSEINADRPIADRIVPAAAFVRAVAIAAARHRELNGTWTDDRFHPASSINVSVAISLRGGGLVTPTIGDADTMSLDETMGLLREFATVARSGTLRSEWTAANSSITVTNLGERGADLVHGLISPPEVALVGFGRVIERAVVVDGAVLPRPVVTATLGADHRATDGATGSRFLATLASTLEELECL